MAIPSLPPADFLIRPMDGHSEAAVVPDRPGMATVLLERLVVGTDGGAVDVLALPVAVHDRLLAHLYRLEYGEDVSCQASCRACAQPFQFRFALPALLTSQDEDAGEAGLPSDDGCWETPSGVRLRPPVLSDAAAGAPEGLIARIARLPVPAEEVENVAAFLEKASPILAIDLDTACPGCGAAQSVAFDLARFLVRALAGERPFLIREIHLIAARYGWSHSEIMALPRADRRAFATLIESERSASLRRVS
ncbi:MAG TPA: hypothetical protein VF688_02005 [Allosphingosinicella sp.]